MRRDPSSLPVVFGSPVEVRPLPAAEQPKDRIRRALLRTAFNGAPLTSSTMVDAFQPPASR